MTHEQARTAAQTTANEIGQPVAVVEDTLRPDHDPDRFSCCPADAAPTLHRFGRIVEVLRPPGHWTGACSGCGGTGCDDCEWTGRTTGRDQAAG